MSEHLFFQIVSPRPSKTKRPQGNDQGKLADTDLGIVVRELMDVDPAAKVALVNTTATHTPDVKPQDQAAMVHVFCVVGWAD